MIKRFPMVTVAAAVLAAGALFLAACGGDDSTSSSSGGGGGSDADYVTATCKAQDDFVTALTAIDDPTTDAAKAKGDTAIANLATAMGKMNPPADAKAYHDQIIKFLGDARKTVKDKGLLALSGSQPGDPPAAVAARLDTLAAKDKNCTDAHFTFATPK